MKYTKYLYLIFICLFLNACSDDKNIPGDDEEEERSETLAWIEDTMREKYLWSDNIPAANRLNYSAEPEPFFTSLLYAAKDGKPGYNGHHYYSTIERVSENTRGSIQENKTYGFEFTTVWFDGNPEFAYALILYVLPNTPAAAAELKRGDWIVEVDNNRMTTDEATMSLFGDVAKTLKIARWNNQTKRFIDTRTVSINSAESINYNPIYQSDIFTTNSGKKVGYLVYDSFVDGKNDNDTSFDDELRNLSNQKFNGVDEFVLDLRYNNGGLLTCVELLCAILGPSDILTRKNIGYLQYNNKSKSNIVARLGAGGKNLGLPRLFVLVSSRSASASEAVISLLKPLMDVVVIGEVTEGKNVASQLFTSKDKVWEMRPITSTLYNSQDESDYANGITPDIKMGDTFDYDNNGYIEYIHDDIYDLGERQERLLKVALSIIDKNSYNDNTSRGVIKPTGRIFREGQINSLERKATNGVIINIDK